jgi:predicted dehydrogenase
MKNIDRRNFLKRTSLSAASFYLASSVGCSEKENNPSGGTYMGDFSAPKLDTVRIALIGVGARGSGHAKQLASIEGTQIVAISDVYEDLVDRSVGYCEAIGNGRHTDIARYFGDENAWKKMLSEVKPDAVFIATNWRNHAPMAIETMMQGAHAFVEVPIAVTLDEMWKIVDTSEQTQKHCMMI